MTTELTRNDPIVFHFRLGKGEDMEPKTGATVVFLPKLKRFGLALCCAKDRYCRRWGREVATIRASEGEQLRVRDRRFNPIPNYSGPLEMEAIKASAQALVYYAARRVNNPLMSEGSFFVGEEEKIALENIGLARTITDVTMAEEKRQSEKMRLQDSSGAVDITIQAREGEWWGLKGSKIKAACTKSFMRCKSQIRKRFEMHQNGIAVLSGSSFILQEDFCIAPMTDSKTMNLSPVASFANGSPSHGRGFEPDERT